MTGMFPDTELNGSHNEEATQGGKETVHSGDTEEDKYSVYASLEGSGPASLLRDFIHAGTRGRSGESCQGFSSTEL